MKSLFWHYVILIVPIIAIVSSYLLIRYSPIIFVILLCAFLFIYIPFFNGRRLYLKHIIPQMKLQYFVYLDPKRFAEVYFKE